MGWCGVLYLYTFKQLSNSSTLGCTVSTLHLFNTVFCEHCGFHLSVPVYCKNRFCPTCSHHRNRVIRHKLETFIHQVNLRKYDSFKFLTLTIRNHPDLQVMTDELIKSFRRLRQRAYWKKHVRGGACVIEAKKGKDGWHVHLHIVIESAFLKFDVLVALWKSVSTGQGVYIEKLHSTQVVHYLTKYLTQEKATKEEQKTMTDILKGRRLFQPFGSWFDPISKIPRLKFCCPVCERVSWTFGDVNTYFNRLSVYTMVDRRIYDSLQPMNSNQQAKLSLSSDGITMNVD